MIFSTRAIIILVKLYIALNDNNAVKDPAPAINGNTIGTIVADPYGPSLRNISTPNIISIAITNITREPAIANEDISTWNN